MCLHVNLTPQLDCDRMFVNEYYVFILEWTQSSPFFLSLSFDSMQHCYYFILFEIQCLFRCICDYESPFRPSIPHPDLI